MRKMSILMCMGAVLWLTACGNDSQIIEGKVKTVSAGPVENESGESGIEQQKEVLLEKGQEETVETYSGYVFIYNNVAMEIDADAAPVIEHLGAANAYFEAPSCAFEGIDKMYTYNSFEVDTYPMGSVDYISTIVFKDDSVMTMEGVGIGESLDKVYAVYGEKDLSGGGALTYEKDGMQLIFIIRDDSVASVEYRSTVLDE